MNNVLNEDLEILKEYIGIVNPTSTHIIDVIRRKQHKCWYHTVNYKGDRLQITHYYEREGKKKSTIIYVGNRYHIITNNFKNACISLKSCFV